jgi:hypothetical protein
VCSQGKLKVTENWWYDKEMVDKDYDGYIQSTTVFTRCSENGICQPNDGPPSQATMVICDETAGISSSVVCDETTGISVKELQPVQHARLEGVWIFSSLEGGTYNMVGIDEAGQRVGAGIYRSGSNSTTTSRALVDTIDSATAATVGNTSAHYTLLILCSLSCTHTVLTYSL